MAAASIASEQVKADAAARKKFESEAVDLVQSIHAVSERMIAIRHDTTRDHAEVTRLLQNMTQEIKRLEGKLENNRHKYSRLLEKQLNLQGVGFPDSYITSSKLSASGHTLVANSNAPLANSTDLQAATPPVAPQGPDTDDEGDDPDLKLMRTKSTAELAGQPAKSKWVGLFKMFREWRSQTSIAKGQHILGKDDTTNHIDDDIVHLRGAIQALRERKDLTASEAELLKSLQQRLRNLTELKRTGADLEQKRPTL